MAISLLCRLSYFGVRLSDTLNERYFTMIQPNKRKLALLFLSSLIVLTPLQTSHAALYYDNDGTDQIDKFGKDPWLVQQPLSLAVEANRTAYGYLSEALTFLEQKNKAATVRSLENAKNSFLAALKEQPNTVSFNGLAKLSLLQKNDDEAEQWLNKSLSLNPDNPETRYLQAKLLMAQGNMAKAKSILEKIVKNHDTYPLAYIALAEIALQEKQFLAAENYLKRALQLDKTIPAIYSNLAALYRVQGKQNKIPLILQQGYQALQTKPEQSIYLANLLSRYYVENNQPEQALQLGQSVLKKHPDNIMALNLYLDTLVINNKPGQAEKTLANRIKKHPQDVDSRRKLISLLNKEGGNQSKIVALFKEIIAIEKHNAANYIALAHYLFGVKNYSAAKQTISTTREVFPKGNIADILSAELALAQGNTKRAADFYLAAYKKARNNNLLVKVVQALNASDQQDKAIDLLKSEIDHHQSISAHILLAGIYLKDNRLSDAEKLYRAVLKKNPNHYIALNDLAWFLSQRNQDKEALSLAQKAHDIAPNNPEVTDTYQTILKKLGLTNKK